MCIILTIIIIITIITVSLFLYLSRKIDTIELIDRPKKDKLFDYIVKKSEKNTKPGNAKKRDACLYLGSIKPIIDILEPDLFYKETSIIKQVDLEIEKAVKRMNKDG